MAGGWGEGPHHTGERDSDVMGCLALVVLAALVVVVGIGWLLGLVAAAW